MKKYTALLLGMFLVCGLSACSGTSISETADTGQPDMADTGEETNETSDKDVLVIVFSATGNTKEAAGKIAAIENADLYEIIPAQPYTDADLNYNDSGSRATKEQNDASARPEVGNGDIDLSGYSRIYIGYPIWWGQEPRIMDTFVEQHDFYDAEVIPFCTSGSSGIGRSGTDLASLAGTGRWLEGRRFRSGVSEDELRSWIDEINGAEE